jgi:hypothetical protein
MTAGVETLQTLAEPGVWDALERTGELPGYDAEAVERALRTGRFSG